jgi:hypothetical protein
MLGSMVGWRTLAWNVGFVGGGAALSYLSGVDWTQYVSPTVALFITAGVNTVLRVLTKTPVGTK